ncbi:unnamed protein product [Leptidea sinapis]|uniref:Uncharacterized protein n=1 Tax=Leptidea sinapis TaxID=189913 RepID=A0A5E4PZN5_9NEOP|nr:unnamed protein product [Leptidea sinapis]
MRPAAAPRAWWWTAARPPGVLVVSDRLARVDGYIEIVALDK